MHCGTRQVGSFLSIPPSSSILFLSCFLAPSHTHTHTFSLSYTHSVSFPYLKQTPLGAPHCNVCIVLVPEHRCCRSLLTLCLSPLVWSLLLSSRCVVFSVPHKRRLFSFGFVLDLGIFIIWWLDRRSRLVGTTNGMSYVVWKSISDRHNNATILWHTIPPIHGGVYIEDKPYHCIQSTNQSINQSSNHWRPIYCMAYNHIIAINQRQPTKQGFGIIDNGQSGCNAGWRWRNDVAGRSGVLSNHR